MSMNTPRPYNVSRCSSDAEIAHPTWRIYKDGASITGTLVWHCRDDDGVMGDEDLYPPQHVRDEYERLLREAGWTPSPSRDFGREFNATLWGSEFDQACKWGQNADGYAVYCTNDAWLYGPRKCGRDRERWTHEKCEGFCANPALSPDGKAPDTEGTAERDSA